jgi:hypothetical protein
MNHQIQEAAREIQGRFMPVLNASAKYVFAQEVAAIISKHLTEQWVKTPETMPEEKMEVVVACFPNDGEPFPMEGVYRIGNEWFSDNEDGRWCLNEYNFNVTHWMEKSELPPLPSPPE